MNGKPKQPAPARVTDLVERHNKGAQIVCQTEFDILPVDFQHRSNPFTAYIFLCRYSGSVDGEAPVNARHTMVERGWQFIEDGEDFTPICNSCGK